MDKIEKAESRRCEALKSADGAALNALLADDFLYAHASGRTEDKASYVASVTSGTFSLKGFRHRDVKVSRAGNTAVMSGTITVTREADGNTKDTDFGFVGVWVDAGGSDRLLFWKHSKV